MSGYRYASAGEIVRLYRDGDERGWPAELSALWTDHREDMLVLMDSVLEKGFLEPILLGSDGRVWDGHHRIAVGLALGLLIPTAAAEADQ